MKTFHPIVVASRIEVVDVLRGFALFGVLLANVPYDHIAAEASPINSFLSFFHDMFINRKFITLFSMLFGFGFYIQLTRARQNGINFQWYFIRRMGLLFLIGALHCFLLWNGDIIMTYAVGGILLLIVRDWSVKRLTWLALIFSIVLTGVLFIGNAVLGWQEHTYDFDLVLRHPLAESYLEYVDINFRIASWVNFAQDMPVTLVFTFGNMLVGLILGKLNFFSNLQALGFLYRAFIFLGSTLGLLCSYLFYSVNSGTLELSASLVWLPFFVIGGMMFQTLAYITIFVKMSDVPIFRKVTEWLKYVGRTALSNYIFQSVFYVFVIFKAIHKYGLYNDLSRIEIYFVAVEFFLFMSVISYLWLERNKQGPMEYIWKTLSYYKLYRHK